MAFPTAVNSQIADAVTQANVSVLSSAPAQAMGSLYQAMAQALSISAENAVSNQQNANTVATAVVSRCVSSLVRADSVG
ncbi:MAG: RebB family R body protein [Wenzhouxiangellaceae bacterium]